MIKKRRVRKGLILIIGVLLVILVLFIGLNITGFVITEELSVSVFRLVEGNNVTLSVVSSENVLAIQENFSSPECRVVDYGVEPEISIFAFKDSENTWILANKSEGLVVDLFYSFNGIDNESLAWCNGADFDEDGDVDGADFGRWQAGYPTSSNATHGDGDADGDGDVDGFDYGIYQANYPGTNCIGSIQNIDCSVVFGIYFIISEGNLVEGVFEESGESQVALEFLNSPDVSSSGSGSGVSSSVESEIILNEIVEVESKEELQNVVENALRKISSKIGGPKKTYALWIVALVLVILAIAFFIVLNLNKQKMRRK